MREWGGEKGKWEVRERGGREGGIGIEREREGEGEREKERDGGRGGGEKENEKGSGRVGIKNTYMYM